MSLSDKEILERCQVCLNTPEGLVLMGELRSEFEDLEIWDDNPLVMARKAANRDFFKVLEAMQNGLEMDQDGG